MLDIPRDPASIERPWVAGLLARAGTIPDTDAVDDVVIVETMTIGMTSTITRVAVSYSSPVDGPRSIIVKLPAVDPKWRRIVNDGRLFEREAGFYSGMQAAFPMRTPRCFLSHVDRLRR